MRNNSAIVKDNFWIPNTQTVHPQRKKERERGRKRKKGGKRERGRGKKRKPPDHAL